MVLAPLVARVVQARFFGGTDPANILFHTLVLTTLRMLLGHLVLVLSRLPVVIPGFRVQRKGISFEQMDREKNWWARHHALRLSQIYYVMMMDLLWFYFLLIDFSGPKLFPALSPSLPLFLPCICNVSS